MRTHIHICVGVHQVLRGSYEERVYSTVYAASIVTDSYLLYKV